jgi:putative oxidoreductase
MEKVLGRFGNLFYAALRIVAGFLFACHGAQKVLGLLGGTPGSGGPAEMFSLFWIAGLIELVGGVLIAIGFRASWAAFLCSGEMAAAYFIAHQPKGALPIQNGGELAVLYAFVFLYIAARGSGTLSVDGGK